MYYFIKVFCKCIIFVNVGYFSKIILPHPKISSSKYKYSEKSKLKYNSMK